MATLVTGGAGFIGAHVVRLLQDRGDRVVVVDDLSVGHAARASGAPLVRLDVSGPTAVDTLTRTLVEHEVTAVVHLAGRKRVDESVRRPTWYYQQNVVGMVNLVAAMEAAQVDRLVFSSSAATYGAPAVPVVDESMRPEPVSPYGETKLAGEWAGRAAARAWGLRFVALRYFNVAGAGWPDLGDQACVNLVPRVLDRLARGERPRIFGDDFATPDGTCVRDYLHVQDLAEAHLVALAHLDEDERRHDVFNLGTGTGCSVKEILDQIGAVSGLDMTPEILPRRPGDPPWLVAAPDLVVKVLGWRASRGLEEVIGSAWGAWQAGPRRIDV